MRWLSDRAIPVLVVMFCAGVAVVLWQQQRLHEQLVYSAGEVEARRFAAALETFRTLYTSEVVATAREHGLDVTHDYDNEARQKPAIPLPATLSMKLGNELGARLKGGQTKLYSAFPFPYSERDGLSDQFARDAWVALNQNPDAPYQRFVETDDGLVLRYAIADRMRSSCVECHNSHADSPRRDWKEGDVRGVLEVSLPLDVATEQVSSNMRESFALLAGVGGVGLAGLILVIGRLRKTSEELEQRVEERTRELRQTAQSLERQEAQSRVVIESSPVALMVVDRSGRITLVNQQAELLFGYSQSELLGQSVEMLVPEAVRPGHESLRDGYFQNPVMRAIGEGRLLHGTRKDGTEIPIEIGLTPVDTDSGPAALTAIMDLRERKRTEARLSQQAEELRAAKEEADQANRAKSAFLANMSHEIRTPMNGIIGMCELLANSRLESEQREFLTMMQQSADALLRLINDILDFSKIEAGRLELEDVAFGLRDSIGLVGRTLSTRASEKRLELACRIAPDIPDVVRGDPGRLQQVLINLAGNAIKFTDEGEVVIDVDGEPMGNERLRLNVTVRDTGIGIEADRQQDIFQSFRQADSSTTRRFGGTGLGLTISAQLVELMHGAISVESTPGEGSTFRFSIELGVEPNQAVTPSADLGSMQGTRVLIVDDNETNRRILQELLLNWKLQPLVAASGQEGLQLLTEARQSGESVPLVLLDCMMPGMDGFEFARKARDDAEAAELTIIMISSAMQAGDTERCASVGIARCMSKPVIQSELLGAIAAEFGRRSADSLTTEHQADSPSTQPRRVLIAEDGVINQRVATALLEQRGHQAVVVSDGQQAVDILEHEQFDVVLMDVQMPVLDGYSATTAIRERERSSGGHLAIVAMTANAMKGDRERCLDAGMDDYVSKPIDRAELLRAVEAVPATVLSVKGISERDDAGSQPADADVEPATDPAPHEGQLIDWPAARRNMPPNEAFVREMAELLLTEAPRFVHQIQAAIVDGDADAVHASAHKLKSCAGTMCVTELQQVAQQIEEMALAEQLDQVKTLSQQLDEFTVQLTNEVQTFLADTSGTSEN